MFTRIRYCIYQRKKIIPISIDDTKSYGFINHIQSKSIKENNLKLIVCEGLLEYAIDYGFSGIKNELKESNDYRYSEDVLQTLQQFYHLLSNEQVNEIIEISISNIKVWDSAECANILLPKLIRERGNDIELKKREIIEYQIQKREWHKN